MIPEITEKNLYLLLPGKVSAVVEQYVQNHGGSLLDGLRKFYNSSTYHRLENEQTKLWHLGPVGFYMKSLSKMGSYRFEMFFLLKLPRN